MPTERMTILDEPGLEFSGGYPAMDPHDGLALFGSVLSAALLGCPTLFLAQKPAWSCGTSGQ
jgi:hypothetical protein